MKEEAGRMRKNVEGLFYSSFFSSCLLLIDSTLNCVSSCMLPLLFLLCLNMKEYLRIQIRRVSFLH